MTETDILAITGCVMLIALVAILLCAAPHDDRYDE